MVPMSVAAKLSRKLHETLGDEAAEAMVSWMDSVEAPTRRKIRGGLPPPPPPRQGSTTMTAAPGSIVRTQSQYNDSFSNQFFSEGAISAGTDIPKIAADAGQLQLAATEALLLNGTIGFGTATYTYGKDAKGNPLVRAGRGGRGDRRRASGRGFPPAR